LADANAWPPSAAPGAVGYVIHPWAAVILSEPSMVEL
jgi:hypothetical protein